MKSINARLRRAPAPLRIAKRAPRNLGRALQIENAERISQIDVIFRLEIKLRFGPPAADFDVRGFVLSHRNAFVRDVRQRRKQLAHARFRLFALLIEFRDAFFQFIDCFAASVGFFALAAPSSTRQSRGWPYCVRH